MSEVNHQPSHPVAPVNMAALYTHCLKLECSATYWLAVI